MSAINNKMDSNLTGMWVSFFTAAGIPSDVSATYALTFTENRIQNDMLLDLNKEYLRDMGISRMGDVIAILRHAKQVHESTARDRVLSTTTPAAKVPVAAVTGRATVASQPSSPASRILEHYTRNPQVQEPPSPATQLKRKSLETGNNDVNMKKSRLIRFAEASQPQIKEASKTVFARLGNSEPIKVSMKAAVKPIYARLGNKSEKQVPDASIPIDKDALKYEGILKSMPVKKVFTVTTSQNDVRKIAVNCTMRADEKPVSVKAKLAAPKSVKFSNHVQYKEIEGNKKAALQKQVQKPVPKFTQVFNKPERRLSMPEPSNSVKGRLGAKDNSNNLTITRNVFNRLGV
ncbi:unnamed protein product [Chrysodeixis includens]|uniref:SAM domain-containing protein n=1 Tax=Chrysodeixis includens TaxID=689277 RepID=A0A9P0FRR5_CHRIL|nr:unnamed protein product [Chrysodeixis includens]